MSGNPYQGGVSNSNASTASQTSDAGYITRMVDTLSVPLTSQHSLSGWLMMLALGGIAVFIWTRLLKYIRGE